MLSPEINEQQVDAMKSVKLYLDEVEKRDKSERLRILNSELHTVINILTPVQLLRIVAQYFDDK